jgi:hypothetical protein
MWIPYSPLTLSECFCWFFTEICILSQPMVCHTQLHSDMLTLSPNKFIAIKFIIVSNIVMWSSSKLSLILVKTTLIKQEALLSSAFLPAISYTPGLGHCFSLHYFIMAYLITGPRVERIEQSTYCWLLLLARPITLSQECHNSSNK